MQEKATVGAVAGGSSDEPSLPRTNLSPQQESASVCWEQFRDFIGEIGRDHGPLVVALFPPEQGPCIHVPCSAEALPTTDIERTLEAKAADGLALGLVLNHPLPEPPDWGSKPEHLNRAGLPKAWGASDKHISHAIGIWAECDGGLSLEAQEALPKLAGLPEPSLRNWSGGKSLHMYWLLAPGEVLEPGLFKTLQQRLAARLVEVAPDAKPDTGIHNPARVMRVPGGLHPKTGERCTIHSRTGKRFTVAELLEILPDTAASSAPAPVPARLSVGEAIPLEKLLPRDLEALALQGVPEGGEPDGGRNNSAFRLAAVALAVADAAAADGLRVEGSPQSVVLAFAARCSPPLPEREALACLGSAESSPRSVDAGWPSRRDYWRHQQRGKAAPPKQQQQQSASGQQQPRRELTPQEKLSALRRLAAELLEQQTPFPDRVPLLRARAESLDLTLRDQELQRLLWDARRARAGTIDPLGTGEVIDLTPCPWHWEGVLMAACLNLIAALPKTGKTSLLLALIGAWRRGQPDFLGIPLIGTCPPVLIVGTDQPASDWGRMMREVGLLGDCNEILLPIVALFHKARPLHLDYEGIERIAAYASQNQGLMILLDSISACTISLGLDENSAEIVEPINDLMEAVSPYRATVVAIHHASKGRQGESATLASRGSTALPAAASQVIALQRMASPLAGPPDRRLVLKTEGRGGMPQQLLIERTEDGWINHGSAEAVAQAQALQEVEDKLTDRQADALEVVRNRWSNGKERTDAQILNKTLKLGGDGNRKARQTLHQLTRKGLLQSIVEVGVQGRNKWFWPLGAEASRGVLSDDSLPSEASEPLAHVDPRPNSDSFPNESSEGKEGSEGQENTPRESLRSPETSQLLHVTVEGEPGWLLASDRIPESGNVLVIDPDGRNHHVAASGVTAVPRRPDELGIYPNRADVMGEVG